MPKVTQVTGGSWGLNSKVCGFPFHASPLVNGMFLISKLFWNECGSERDRKRAEESSELLSLCSGCWHIRKNYMKRDFQKGLWLFQMFSGQLFSCLSCTGMDTYQPLTQCCLILEKNSVSNGRHTTHMGCRNGQSYWRPLSRNITARAQTQEHVSQETKPAPQPRFITGAVKTHTTLALPSLGSW